MKTQLFITQFNIQGNRLFILSIFCCLLLGCEKTETLTMFPEVESSHNQLENNFEELVFSDLEAVVEVVVDFSDAMKLKRKEGTALVIEEAQSIENSLFLLESTLNYDFKGNVSSIENTKKQVLTLFLTKDETGRISGEDLAKAYNEVLYPAVSAMLDDDNLFMIGDVEILDDDLEKTELGVVVFTTKKRPVRVEEVCRIHESDYWLPGNADGLCHPTLPNTYLGAKDAADRLEEVINNPCLQPTCENGQYTINWLLVKTEFFNYADSPLGNLIFWTDDCQDPMEMENNLNILNDIIQIYHPPQQDYKMQFVDVHDHAGVSSDVPFYVYQGAVVYAVTYCVPCCN